MRTVVSHESISLRGGFITAVRWRGSGRDCFRDDAHGAARHQQPMAADTLRNVACDQDAVRRRIRSERRSPQSVRRTARPLRDDAAVARRRPQGQRREPVIRQRCGDGALQQRSGARPTRCGAMRRPPSRRLAQPTKTRALRNMRSHGESSPHAAGRWLSCTLRNTRSGWGIMIVTRPSAVVRAVSPRGEPLGLCG
jgi:hypothetical protein